MNKVISGINNIFNSTVIDKSLTATQKIILLERAYYSSLKYINENVDNQSDIRCAMEYAHVLFSNRIGQNGVSIADYVSYLEEKARKEQEAELERQRIAAVMEEVNYRIDPTKKGKVLVNNFENPNFTKPQ